MRCTLSIILAFICSLSLNSQGLEPELQQLLNASLSKMQNNMGIKSLSAAITVNENKAWTNAHGVSSSIPKDSVRAEYSYLIGSVTKMITTACILKLQEQGLLNINDTIGKFIEPIPYINARITVKQLLGHTSGIYDVLNNPDQQQALLSNVNKRWEAEEFIRQFINAPNFNPGAKWEYSNTNYFLLDMIIQKVTGKKFYEVFRELLFDPFQLDAIKIPAFETLTQDVAHVWLDITGDGLLDDAHDFYMSYMSLNSVAGAAGGYFATSDEISKWSWHYLRGDILSHESMDLAKTFITAQGSQGGKYGLGLMGNKFNGITAYGHGGDLAYSASSWYFPSLDISITVLGNDAKYTSWTLLPVVAELLKTYTEWKLSLSEEMQISSGIKIFPNPCQDLVYVDSEKMILKVDILDLNGKVILSKIMNASSGQIETNVLPQGQYILHAQSEKSTENIRFQKFN